MTETLQCDSHGSRYSGWVCAHLAKDDSIQLGLHRDAPSKETPCPDAWCDTCEKVRLQHGGEWNETSEAFCDIKFLCSECYRQVCIRNARTSSSLDALKDYRWKCGSCDEWHYGPTLDIAYKTPYHWNSDNAENSPDFSKSATYPPTFITRNYCVMNAEDYFIRGIIKLPIIGTDQSFCWGVWGSLSKESFDAIIQMQHTQKSEQFPPMFSWLCTKLDDYPNTLSLKMNAHINSLDETPMFDLEPTDHPLSQEYYNGITPEKVKEITIKNVASN